MPRNVESEAASAVWQSLLGLRTYLCSRQNDDVQTVALICAGETWSFAPELSGESGEMLKAVLLVPLADSEPLCEREAETLVRYDHGEFSAGGDPIVTQRGALDPEIETILRMYLPCIVGGFLAKRRGSAFVLAHVAQTLDGRIACSNGQSQWISNEANLLHAHRLRALHDAVVVGAQTVITDDPELTVRHVPGENPIRVILSASASCLRSDASFKVFEGEGCTVLCDPAFVETLSLNGRHEKVDVVPVQVEGNDGSTTQSIIDALVARGIHSIFVEGGGRTISSFLESAHLDVLHIHIAPLVLGSGISGFRLPEATTIDAGKRMHMEQFSMDGEVLLECREERPQE